MRLRLRLNRGSPRRRKATPAGVLPCGNPQPPPPAPTSATPVILPAVAMPYGLRSDGVLVHVSLVASGLECDCTCPGCHTPLVAKKGADRAHHFSHHGDHACSRARESALHLLAKQVLQEARAVWLPAVVATARGRHRTMSRELSAAKNWAYERAEEEVVMPGVRPDVVLHRGDRRLLVEVFVTNVCGPDKIQRLRDMKLSAVEIDLSEVDLFADPEVHREAILRTAPRKWLVNQATEAPSAALAAQLAIEDAAHAEQEKSQIETILGALREPPVQPSSEFLEDLEELIPCYESGRFSGHFGVGRVTASGFTCSPRLWQAAVFRALAQSGKYSTTAYDLTREMVKLSVLPKVLQDAAKWDRAMVSSIRREMPHYHPPEEVIEQYLVFLRTRGTASRRGGRYRLSLQAKLWVPMADSQRHLQRAAAILDRSRATDVVAAEPPLQPPASDDSVTWSATRDIEHPISTYRPSPAPLPVREPSPPPAPPTPPARNWFRRLLGR